MSDLCSRGGTACSNKIGTPQDSNWISSRRKGLINITFITSSPKVSFMIRHTYVHNMSVTQMLQKRHRKLDRMECFCIQKIMNFPVFYANEVLVTLSWAVRPWRMRPPVLVGLACNNTFAQTVIQASSINFHICKYLLYMCILDYRHINKVKVEISFELLVP